jgi:hypothetical protein
VAQWGLAVGHAMMDACRVEALSGIVASSMAGQKSVFALIYIRLMDPSKMAVEIS